MSVALDILRTYRAPRTVLSRRIGTVEREDRALVTLLVACVFMFIAQWPRLARESHLNEDVPFDALMAAALFGWILFAPLFFYVLSWLTHLVMRLFRLPSTGYKSRMALFWALLAAAPLWLLAGLTAGFIGPGPALTLTGGAATLAFLLFWVLGLVEITSKRGAQAG